MAEYWVGPSLRQSRPRWATPNQKGRPSGQRARKERRLARPLTPRRWRAFLRLASIKLHDITFLARYSAHIIVLVLAIAVGWLHGKDFSYLLDPATPVETETNEATLWRTEADQDTVYLTWNALPQTIIPERPAAARLETITYEVREGDNPSIIAARFGLQPSTIVWSNKDVGENPDLLSIGQVLVIPPVDGVLHTVEPGDTLTAIASEYEVDVNVILDYEGNSLSDPSAPLVQGQYVVVPGGVVPYEPPPPVVTAPPASASTSASSSSPSRAASSSTSSSSGTSSASSAASSTSTSTYVGATGCCRWPVSGRITTQPSNWHMALDIATSLGTPVVAGDGGKVVAAGWDNTGYGYRVIIDHGNGIQTLYAHLSYYLVDYGDYVNKGAIIGKVGSTGRSTGPHLHFEVRRSGYRMNPYNWLP